MLLWKIQNLRKPLIWAKATWNYISSTLTALACVRYNLVHLWFFAYNF